VGTSEKRASEGEIAQEMGEAKAQYNNRRRRPVVQRVRLPDTGELELCAPVVAKAEVWRKERTAIRGTSLSEEAWPAQPC